MNVSSGVREAVKTMEFLPQVDSVLREYIPGVLSSAGLPEQADALRDLKPIIELDSISMACELLRDIGEKAHLANPAEWAGIVEEVAFWAEAAVLSAASNNGELFIICLRMIQKAESDGERLLTIH